MADVNFNRGYKQFISNTGSVPFKPGSISIAEDTRELYIDANNNQRIKITDVVDITGVENPTLISGKIYINGTKLQKVQNNQLVDVSSTGNSVVNTDKTINLDTRDITKGTIEGKVGKVGDFIIDQQGNVGIVINQQSNTTVQIVSMYGSENRKAEYFMFVGEKAGSKELGTIDDPYSNTEFAWMNNVRLFQNSTELTINCVSDTYIVTMEENWHNVTINGNNHKIEFQLDDGNHIHVMNCKFTRCDIINSKYVKILNCENDINVAGCKYVDIINADAGRIALDAVENVYIDGIKNNVSRTIIDARNCGKGTIHINNGMYAIQTSDSTSTSLNNPSTEDLEIVINNSELDTLNIDSKVNTLKLSSGKYVGSIDSCNLNAKEVYLGTFEFLVNPNYGTTTKVIDRVGLSSKQLYDTKNRKYINDYSAKHSNITKKSNLEFHLDAIDDSLTDVHDTLDNLSENGSGLGEAFISKGTFKVPEDLQNKTWRTGDVLKFVGNTPIEITKNHPMGGPEQLIETVETITNEETGEEEEKKYFEFYFPSGKLFTYFAHYADLIHTTYVDDSTRIDFELPIRYCGEDVIICRVEQTDENRSIFIPFTESNSTERRKYVDTWFDHNITLNRDDRIIYVINDWDKLVSSGDAVSGNYRIVNTRPELNFIMTDATRPVGMLGYVVSDEIMYQWKEKNGKLQWVTFSSGSGGGLNGAQLKVIDKSPTYGLTIQDNVYLTVEVYNCTTGILSVSYNVRGKSVRRLSPINVSGPITETITLKDFKMDIDPGVSAVSLNVSISFISTDPQISNPSSVNNVFYLGSTVSISYDKLNGIENSGRYILKDNVISPQYNVDAYLLTNSFDVNNCSFDFNVVSISDERYKTKYSLYKNGTLMNTVSSDNLSGTGKCSLAFPSLMSDNNTPIVYDAGIYEIEFWCETTETKSSTLKYKFILEDNIAPKVFILNDIEDKLVSGDVTAITVNLLYVSIYNRNNYELTIHPTMINAENDEIYTSEELVSIRNKTYNETSIIVSDEYNQLLSSIKQNDAYQKDSVKIKYNNLSSNSKSVTFKVQDSILINKDRLVYNLSSLGKSNTSNDKYYWKSSIVRNDNLQVTLNSFDFADGGWVTSQTEDSGIIPVLTGNGYDTSVSVNLSPLYKYDNNIFTSGTDSYDVNQGYSVQIKFKAIKTNTEGTILECIDDQGKGFIITENRVVFSPYRPLSMNFYGNSQILGSGLLSNEWHEITFVVTVAGDEINKSPYEQYMYDKNMYTNTGDSNCKSCAFLYIDGILSGMTYGNGNDGTDPNNPAQWYSTSIINERIMTLFARYDHKEKNYYDFGKGQIMHLRQYNKALTPEEVLSNYIADIHDETIQNQSVIKNGLQNIDNEYVFGFNSDEALPTLHFYNADLSQLDSIAGTKSKDYQYPNTTVTLKYHGKTIFRHYGCELKVQGTSSTNYAIKNYRLRFYDYKVTDEDKRAANITNDDQLSNFMLPNDRVFKPIDRDRNPYDEYIEDSNIKRYSTLWNNDDIERKSYKGAEAEKYGKGKKLKESVNGWLPESRYTLKADYMDSSHTHNTGTARLANEYMPEIPPQVIDDSNPYNITNTAKYTPVSIKIDDVTDQTTQEEIMELTPVNPVTKIRQAIDGFPILVTYSCPSDPNDKNSTPISTVQKGIYMFNLDKSANFNFGYEDYKNRCKSYEVSNNEAVGNSNAAGFNVDLLNVNENYEVINDNPLMQVKNEIESRYHYNEELNEDTMDELVDKLKLTFNITEDDSTSSGIVINYVNGDNYSQGIRIEAPMSLADGLNKTHDEMRNLLASTEYGYTRIIGHYEDEYGNKTRYATDIYDEPTEYIREELIKISDEVKVSASNDNLRSCVLTFNGVALNPRDKTLVLGLTSAQYEHYLYDADTHQNDELKHLMMWFKYCANKPGEFANSWSKHLDINNMEHYIILVKCLGMVDNLAKNMMITTWDADKEYIVYTVKNDNKLEVNWTKSTFAKWYLQFYDLDTSFGLTNDGHLNHERSLTIKGHKMDDITIVDDVDKSTITDIALTTFNAYNSNLWNQLFDAYDKVNYGKSGNSNTLQFTYNNIRSRSRNPLTIETFKRYIIDSITDKIGEYYFNLDAINKYFGWNFIKPANSTVENPFNAKDYFYMCLGSARNQMLSWLNDRLIYMDTYYSYRPGNTAVRPWTNNEGATVFIKPLTPLYYYIQTADDSTIIPQLLTSQANNIFKYDITSDANQVWPYFEYISEISNLGLLKSKTLNLLAASNLVKINLGDCTDLTELQLASKYLKELNAANLINLSALNISNLTSLVDLDISNSKISSLTTGDVALRKLNISGSKLTNIDLSKLSNLESLGKVNISTNTDWNTYSKFIQRLETMYIIPKIPSTDADNYNDVIAERNNYLNNILNQFKQKLSSRNLLNTFNTETGTLTTASEKLNYLFSNNKYKNEIGEQYIPNLAIIQGDTDINAIKLNSGKIKAVYLVPSKQGTTYGVEDGYISIVGDNVKYIRIDACNLSVETTEESDKRLKINCKNLEELVITNSYYSDVLDLSTCENVTKLDLTNNYKLNGILLSQKCRDNGMINSININNAWDLRFICTQSEYTEDENLIDLTNFNLNKLTMRQVIYFTKIKGLNLTLTNTDNFSMELHTNNSYQTPTNPDMLTQLANFYNNSERICTFENSTITIANNITFENKFMGHCNMKFNFGQTNGLKINGLDKITSFVGAFEFCWNLTWDDVCYILGVEHVPNSNPYEVRSISGNNKPINCRSFYKTFAYCIGINFPIITSRSSSKRLVPGKLFTNCKSASSMANMFGGINRKTYKGSIQSFVNYTDGNKESKVGSLILGQGLFHITNNSGNYITNISIPGIFSECGYDLSNSIHMNGTVQFPYVSDSFTVNQNNMYLYNSYIYAVYDDVFEKLTGLDNIGNLSNWYPIFAKRTNSSDIQYAYILKTTTNNSTSKDCFYHLIKNCSSFNYHTLFSNTCAIKWAANVDNAIRNTNYEFITISSNIFKNKSGNYRTVNSLYGTFANFNTYMKLDYMYENPSSDNPDLAFKFNLFGNIDTVASSSSTNNDKYINVSSSNGIDLSYCFYNNKAITKFDPTMFIKIYYNEANYTRRIKVGNMRYMFANCSNMEGLLYRAKKVTEGTENNEYYEIYNNWKKFSIFTGQNTLSSVEGTFKSCTKLGGLITKNIDENDFITYDKTSDLPTNIFESLEKCTSMDSLFMNCTKMTFDFSDYDKDKSNYVYLFKNCYMLKNIGRLFSGCTGMIHRLPTYANKGDKRQDVSYFYYDIFGSIKHWVENITSADTIIRYKNDGYFTYPDNYSPYETDAEGNPLLDDNGNAIIKEDEIENRIVMIDDFITNCNDWKRVFTQCHVVYQVVNNEETNVVEKINQYYKAYNSCEQVVGDYTNKNGELIHGSIYCGIGVTSFDTRFNIGIHRNYIRNEGFFYISKNNINNNASNPIQNISYVFDNCSKLCHGIPSNLFKDMTNVTQASYVFNSCNSIGYDELTFINDSSFQATEQGGHGTKVEPPYCMTYGLLDDLINVTSLSAAFQGVRHLSKPYTRIAYWPNLFSNQYNEYENDYNELYFIPQYFLYYNTKLKTVQSLFNSPSGTNFLFGIINEDMFINNKEITNISACFKSTCVVGCKHTANKMYNNESRVYYVGEKLLYPLINLTDASQLFQDCLSPLLNIVDVTSNNRELLFTSSRHVLKTLKTVNLVTGADSQAYESVFNTTVKGKLVRNSNALSINNDYQCKDWFTSAAKADTLQEYIQ